MSCKVTKKVVVVRKTKRKRGKGKGSSLLLQYLNSLNDPFNFSPPMLGFGSLLGVKQQTAFLRYSQLESSATNVLLVAQPQATNIYANYTQSTSSSPWGAGSSGQLNCTNLSSIQALAETGRVISLGMRVVVRSPATSAPPLLLGGVIYDSLVNIGSQEPNQTFQLLSMKPELDVNSGLRVNFRPSDAYSFEFTNYVIGGFASNAIVPNCVIMIQNIPAGSTYYVDIIAHLETNAGTNSSGQDELDQATLATEVASPDSAFAKIRSRLYDVAAVNLATEAALLHKNVRSFAARNSRNSRAARSSTTIEEDEWVAPASGMHSAGGLTAAGIMSAAATIAANQALNKLMGG